MIRVLLVDDHEVVRTGLKNYLMLEEDMDVIGEASNGLQAVEMAKSLVPDVILMDLVMDEMDGIEATRIINRENPAVKIIMLTSFYDEKQVFPALEAGALSYLLKTARADEIVQAVRAAARGEARIESRIAAQMVQRLKRPTALHEELTEREMEVLLRIAEGKSNQEIADELYLGIKTVKTHVSHLLQKLQLEDRTQAAIYAYRNGLVQK